VHLTGACSLHDSVTGIGENISLEKMKMNVLIVSSVSIRAYGAEEAFKGKSLNLIDVYARTARTLYSLSCWMSIRIDFLGGVFAAGLASYVVYGHGISANAAGFCIDQAGIHSTILLSHFIVFN